MMVVKMSKITTIAITMDSDYYEMVVLTNAITIGVYNDRID